MSRTLRAIVGASALALALAVVISACSGGSDDADNVSTSGLIDDVTPTPIIFDPDDPVLFSGTSVKATELDEGDCFNFYVWRDASEFVQQATTTVSCSTPHDREAYFRTEFPGGENARYPIDDELEQWADVTCLEEFESYIGLDYVLSVLEIGAVVPTFEEWGDGERAVICYVFPDQGGRLLDSVRNSRI